MEPKANDRDDARSHDEPTLSVVGSDLDINYAAILDTISDAIIATDLESVITGWNRAAERIYGWSTGEVIGKSIDSVVFTDYGTVTRDDAIQQCITQGSWKGDVIQRHKDGQSIDIVASMSLAKDANGRPMGIIYVNYNITQHKQTKQALQASELRYQAIFDSSPDGILIVDIESKRFIYANSSICQMLGYTTDELLKLGVGDIHPPDQLAYVVGQFEAQSRSEICLASEVPCLKKDGTIFYADINATVAVLDSIPCNVGFFRDVTQRRQTEHELHKLSAVVEQSSSSIVITDSAGIIEYVNPRFCEITGYAVEEAIGQNPNILQSGQTPPEVYETLWKTLISGESWHGEFLNRKKNGDLWWEFASIFPIHDANGVITNFVSVKDDITERKRTDAILRESEERYRQVAELLSDYAYMHEVLDDGSLHLAWIVGKYEAITGLPQGESGGYGGWDHLIHHEDIPVTLKRAERLMTGELDVSEFRIVRADGEIRWLRDHGYPVWDAAMGRIAWIYGAVQDITESKNAEQTLIASEQQYRQLIENLHSGVIVYAPDSSIILHNERAAELLGAEGDDLSGKKADELVPQFVRFDRTQLAVEEYPINRVLASHESLVNLELGIIRPHATAVLWVLVNAFPVFDETQENIHSSLSSEKISHVIVTLTDVTERKQAIDDLRRLKEFHETLVQGLAEGIIVTGLDSRIEHVNPAGAMMLGSTVEEVIGRRWLDFIPADQQVAVFAAEARRKQGGTERYEITLTHDDGSELNLLVSGNPRYEGDRYVGSIATFTDISGLVKTQNAVKESRKLLLSTLNALSAHVAILDETGTIIEVNVAWRRFADENDLNDPTYGVGTNYLALCDAVVGPGEEDASIVAAGIRNLLNQNGDGIYLEYSCHSPVEQRWFMMNLNSFLVGTDRRIVMTHHNITERKLAENKERQQRMMADALADVASTINRALDVDEILENIISKVKYIVPHTGANLMLVDVEKEEAKIARYCGCYAENNLPEPRFDTVIPFAEVPNLKSIIEQAKPFVVSDTRTSADWTTVPTSDWIRSYACAPICIDGKVIGLINIDGDTPGMFTLLHAYQLQALADQAAIAIRNAQLYHELENYSEFLEQAVAERTEQLERSTEHIESILNSSIDAILLVQRNGIIHQANPTFDQWFGNPSGDVFGLHLSRLVKPEQVDRVLKALDSVFESHQPQRIEIVAQREDGTVFDADMAISPIQRQTGEVTNAVCSLRDITEWKQAEQTLRQALEREMEVSDMRMRFLSMASHDLRNPMAIIQSSVEMLANYHDRLSDEKKEAKYRQIRASITHMVELLDDVLLIGRVEAGKLSFSPEPIDVETFCQSIISSIQVSIGVNYTFSHAFTGEHEMRQMDPKLLRHILHNLLSNAVKYSPAGSTVTFELAYNEDQAIFRIQDEGIGIPEADQPRLFEPFHRASNVGVTSGTGLGLAIVKQSAELHGGTVSYETQEGVGTVFTVILPSPQA